MTVLRPPLPVDTVARIFELRDEGRSFKKNRQGPSTSSTGPTATAVHRTVHNRQHDARVRPAAEPPPRLLPA